MPQDPDVPASPLKEKALEHMRAAEAALERSDLGEMECQIEQSRHMELAYNLLQQVALENDDETALKYAGEQATKWAMHMRAATTKRRNDEVPRLIQAMSDRKKWARALLEIEEED